MDELLFNEVAYTEKALPAEVEILKQGERCGRLYILVNGAVEVIKNGQQIAVISDKGAIFGELSLLLGGYQNATVRTLVPSQFQVIEEADKFLANLRHNPEAAVILARMLARRLALLDSQYSDLKKKMERLQENQDNFIAEPVLEYW
jgi:CRP-like cAMP-binding protein